MGSNQNSQSFILANAILSNLEEICQSEIEHVTQH